ncbi:hypothetical protein B0H63DRAFT_469904 [Podospora didyma]|uniref:DUF3533 domain-containing protein n=1 Tax=Podospora didyma TaxID=330526 RepID=A0AAE0U1H1_9PEZI|nr:hypothetical protein B0H63DRAFT_469904 [Podospora didyma]
MSDTHHHSSKFLGGAAKKLITLQLLFLGLFAYIFGSLFQQDAHTHNLKIAFVDYDGGAIGAAVRQAYTAELQGDSFPTLVERPASDFPAPADLESAVCSIDYWAALYILPGASSRLHGALRDGADGSPPTTLFYNRHNALAFIWNEARYPTVVGPAIASNIAALSAAARVVYINSTAIGTGRGVPSLTLNTPEAISVLANPWELASRNIQPTKQGSRAIYNTIAIILVIIQDFFFLSIFNGLHLTFQVYNKLHPVRIVAFRNFYSLSYTLIGSLGVTGSIWAFRSGWDVNGIQFVLTWATLWLFGHINFQTFDVLTIWLPHPYVLMSLITWIILNVTSTILPFELSPAFYRVGYVFPAHETLQVLIDIWSRGCNPQLSHALPVLLAWELVVSVLSAVGVCRRIRGARTAEEEKETRFEERIAAAIALREKEGSEKMEEGTRSTVDSTGLSAV